jgi:hypothetical protein
MPISRSRVTPRDRLRFATFAHAMTRTSVTAASRISSLGRTPATSAWWSGIADTVWFQSAGIGQGKRVAMRD